MGLFWFLRQVKRGLQAGFDAAKRYFVDGFVDDFCVVLEVTRVHDYSWPPCVSLIVDKTVDIFGPLTSNYLAGTLANTLADKANGAGSRR